MSSFGSPGEVLEFARELIERGHTDDEALYAASRVFRLTSAELNEIRRALKEDRLG